MYVENCTVWVFVQTAPRLTLILWVAQVMCVCSCVSSTVGGTKYWGSDPWGLRERWDSDSQAWKANISLTLSFSHCRGVEGPQVLRESVEELVPWEERFVCRASFRRPGQASPPGNLSLICQPVYLLLLHTPSPPIWSFPVSLPVESRLASGAPVPPQGKMWLMLSGLAFWEPGLANSCGCLVCSCCEPWPQFSISGPSKRGGGQGAHSTEPDFLNTLCLTTSGPHGCSAGHV